MTVLSAIQAKNMTAVDPIDGAVASQKPAMATPAKTDEAQHAFAATLKEAAGAGSTEAVDATDDARPISAVYRGSKSGILTPVQQFESFVLRSFVETMLPKENTSFFGTGTAGEIWKSMLAERIGDEMAKDGGIGIAELLEKRQTAAGSTDTAKAATAATDRLSIDATRLQGAEGSGQR